MQNVLCLFIGELCLAGNAKQLTGIRNDLAILPVNSFVCPQHLPYYTCVYSFGSWANLLCSLMPSLKIAHLSVVGPESRVFNPRIERLRSLRQKPLSPATSSREVANYMQRTIVYVIRNTG